MRLWWHLLILHVLLAHQVKNVIGKAELGQPRSVICDQVEAEQANMVIVGERGLGAVQRMLLGSVSDYVMKHAKCDVLIAKGDMPDDETTTVEQSPTVAHELKDEDHHE
jgi:hypothetical protein